MSRMFTQSVADWDLGERRAAATALARLAHRELADRFGSQEDVTVLDVRAGTDAGDRTSHTFDLTRQGSPGFELSFLLEGDFLRVVVRRRAPGRLHGFGCLFGLVVAVAAYLLLFDVAFREGGSVLLAGLWLAAYTILVLVMKVLRRGSPRERQADQDEALILEGLQHVFRHAGGLFGAGSA